MVTYNHTGRLGNVLFIAAAAIAYAKKHGLEFHPLSKTHDQFWFPVYLEWLRNPKFNPNLRIVDIHEMRHCFDELPFDESWRTKNIRLNGYFQSEKYFAEYRNEIMEAFRVPYNPVESVVSIHVRRGDYLKYPRKHPVVTMEYIVKAVEHFNLLGYTNFNVFGDDQDWNKKNINSEVFPGCTFDYIYGSLWSDLEQMSSCQHHIISNSSFAWWGAWLNQNAGKIVVCPHEDNHFGIDNKHLDVSDFYPAEWHRIKYKPIYET